MVISSHFSNYWLISLYSTEYADFIAVDVNKVVWISGEISNISCTVMFVGSSAKASEDITAAVVKSIALLATPFISIILCENVIHNVINN